MKKEIMLTLAISMALVSSASAALAAQSTDTNLATVKSGVSFTLASPLEISGKVTEISAGEMTVTTKDGKTYKVPLWQLAKQNGYSALGLKTGTEVSLKTIMPDLANIKVGTLTAGTPLKLDSKNLIKANGSTSTLTAVGSSEGGKTTAAGDTTITPDNGGLATLTAVPGVKLDLSKVQEGTLKIAENSKGIMGTIVTPAGGSFTLTSLAEGESIFIAGEITANGQTVKLNK